MNKRQQERLNAALQYTKTDGYRHPLAIFPLAGKFPLKDSHGFKDATTDTEQVKRWWGDGTYNIGAATGDINGILVIDVDEKEGKHGFDSLRDLEKDLGKLPPTWEVISGSGGRHLYFKYPQGENIKSGEDVLAEWIDVKAQGGYIVLPPSMHPDTHKTYEWEASGDPLETPLADLPDSWLQRLLEVQKKDKPAGEDGEKFTLPDVIQSGKRNKTLYRYACSMRGKKTPPLTIYKTLMQCNSQRCNPPLPERDVERIYNSALKHEEGTAVSILIDDYKEMEKPDLQQFHFFKNGAPSSVYDLAIYEYLVKRENIFVLGGVPYIYQHGVYNSDMSEAYLKTAIRELIYPELVKAPVLQRIYNLFLSARELQITSEDLNNYPAHWINFQNGFYDPIAQKMIPHDAKYRAVNQIPHVYQTDSQPSGGEMESWLQFIVPEADNREMLLQFMGYCLTRDTRQQRFLILCGAGGTGKSTVIRLLEAMIGSSNISNVSLKELTQRFASYALLGKLVNSCADLEVTALEDTSIIKKISGEDAIRTESKGKDAISFHNYARMIFSTNQMPLILSEQTNGFWRRLMILSMNRQPEQVRTDFVDILLREVDYLIHLSIKALERMYKAGRLTESEASLEAVQNLWCDSDSVEAWIRDECSRDRDGEVERVRAHKKYENYCADNGRTSLNRNNFYRAMRSKGFTDRRSNGKDYFKGIIFEKTSLKSPSKLPYGFVSAEGVADNPFV